MNYQLNDEQKSIKENFANFCSKELAPRASMLDRARLTTEYGTCARATNSVPPRLAGLVWPGIGSLSGKAVPLLPAPAHVQPN